MAKQDIKYAIWSTNQFNDEILSELIAHFYDLEAAKDYVDYQLSIGNSFVILQNNKRINYDD